MIPIHSEAIKPIKNKTLERLAQYHPPVNEAAMQMIQEQKEHKERKQSNTDPQYLDEGSYGCIHKPSLLCESSTHIDYKNKVSKIMTVRHLKRELNELKLIEKADPKQQFHLGKPQTCNVRKNPANFAAIGQCPDLGKQILANPENYKLLIMKYGGIDLNRLFEDAGGRIFKEEYAKNQAIVDWLFLELHRVMLGIKTFLKHKIVHHDMKPSNLVYNVEEHKMNFIDFGLMETIPRTMAQSKKNNYQWAVNYWSYPFETRLVNLSTFNRVQRMNDDQLNEFVQECTDVSIEANNEWTDKFFHFTYMINVNDRVKLFADLFQWLSSTFKTISHTEFMRMHLETFDIYGMGIILFHLIHHTKYLIHPGLYHNCYILAMRMVAFNLTERITMDALIEEYQSLLMQAGIPQRHKITFPFNPIQKLVARRSRKKKTKLTVPSSIIRPFVNLNETGLLSVPEFKERQSIIQRASRAPARITHDELKASMYEDANPVTKRPHTKTRNVTRKHTKP